MSDPQLVYIRIFGGKEGRIFYLMTINLSFDFTARLGWIDSKGVPRVKNSQYRWWKSTGLAYVLNNQPWRQRKMTNTAVPLGTGYVAGIVRLEMQIGKVYPCLGLILDQPKQKSIWRKLEAQWVETPLSRPHEFLRTVPWVHIWAVHPESVHLRSCHSLPSEQTALNLGFTLLPQ